MRLVLWPFIIRPWFLEKNADRVIRLLKKESDEIIQWKALLCLSAFPVPEGIRVLKEYAGRTDLLGAEATRSLKLIDGRAKKEKAGREICSDCLRLAYCSYDRGVCCRVSWLELFRSL